MTRQEEAEQLSVVWLWMWRGMERKEQRTNPGYLAEVIWVG